MFLKYFIIRKLTKLWIHGLIKTCKITVFGSEKLNSLKAKGIPVIFVIWHQHIFFCIYFFKNKNICPLISLSEDGELVAQIAMDFGMHPIRGSSSRGGAKAFLQLIATIKNTQRDVLITADGPKGPLREVKDGVILLAQKTGSAIIPVAWTASRQRVFENTWDKFRIPKLFSRIHFFYGDPVFIPEKISKDELQQRKSDLQNRLIQLADIFSHSPEQPAKKDTAIHNKN
jgi:lysophospholipid acyltransferase (LPLAT)-like uncharacterized protein